MSSAVSHISNILLQVIESSGPTNTRVYSVAVYFRGERLANAHDHSIQEAEMNAAKAALENCSYLFPHLDYQKKIVERSFQRQNKESLELKWREEVRENYERPGLKRRNMIFDLTNISGSPTTQGPRFGQGL